MPGLTPWTPVPILMYHAVETAPRPAQYKHFYVTKTEFEGQMRWLKSDGWTPITFGALESAMAGQTPLPAKPVIITFDDGYANLLPNALPILEELGFSATVFLVPEKIGGTNDWVAAEGYAPTPLLSWPEIHELGHSKRVTFGSHTLTHPHLNQLPIAEARCEMRDAKAILEHELQTPITTFCYPYGHYNDAVVSAAAESGYRQAVTTEFGRVHREDNPLRLPRVSIYHVPPLSLTYGIGPLNFRWRVRSRKDSR